MSDEHNKATLHHHRSGRRLRAMQPVLAFVFAAFMSLVMGEANAAAPSQVTFTEHVAPIVFNNCASCHRPGEGTPFSLLNYRDVKKRGEILRTVVKDGYMPPWPPAKGWGHFQDERRLTDEQISLLDRWVDTGMAEGPADKLPALPKFPEGGWSLGKPDLVVTLPEAFDVPADGPDIYRMFVLPLNLPKDQWVTAVEIRPTARSVVHHALYFLDSTGTSRTLDEADPGPGFSRMGFPRTGTLGGWAVGATPRHLPMNLAYSLPKSADLVVQMHFHPSGKAEREQTTFGLYFAKEPPRKRLLGTQAPIGFGIATELRTRGIKPGEKDFTIRGEWTVPFDIDAVSVGGHAHYLCKTMKAVAELPNGEERKLFAIDDWDFNWQGRYHFKDPVRLPKGTVVRTTLVYDNSADNPRNPTNPPKHVRWGEGSTDEMGSIGLAFIAVNETDLASYKGPGIFGGADMVGRLGVGANGLRNLGPERLLAIFDLLEENSFAPLIDVTLDERTILWRSADIEQERRIAIFDLLDADKNGKLEGEEIPERLRAFMGRLDRNGNGALERSEVERIRPGSAPDGQRRLPPLRRGSLRSQTSAVDPPMTDIDGQTWTPHPTVGTKANVLVFVTRDCPIANQYSPEISRLARSYADKSVSFLLVHTDPDTTPAGAREHAKEYDLHLPILLDPEHKLVAYTKVVVTPEAVVIKPDGTIAYSGRIDDRFGKLGRQRPEPSQHDLRDAIDAVLTDQPIKVARVEAIGCPIENLKR